MHSRYKALIVAVNDYRDPQFRPLPNTHNDAEELRHLLLAKPTLFDPKEVQIFQGTQVRLATLRTVISDFFNQATQEDVLFFFWAGHGRLIGNDGYLVTFDTDTAQERQTSLPMSEVQEALKLSQAQTAFAWLDCCHSGAMAGRGQDLHNWMRGLQTSGSGKAIIAACTSTQYAYEHDSRPHGQFTAHLLDGLRGKAADQQGEVTVGGLYDYVAKQLQGGPQTPVLHCTLEGRVVLRVTGSSPEVLHPLERPPDSNEYVGQTKRAAWDIPSSNGRDVTITFDVELEHVWFYNEIEVSVTGDGSLGFLWGRDNCDKESDGNHKTHVSLMYAGREIKREKFSLETGQGKKYGFSARYDTQGGIRGELKQDNEAIGTFEDTVDASLQCDQLRMEVRPIEYVPPEGDPVFLIEYQSETVFLHGEFKDPKQPLDKYELKSKVSNLQVTYTE